jgi:hypothetical protein
VSAAELRTAELALGDVREQSATLEFGKRLDAFIATALLEDTEGKPVTDPVAVIDALLQIAASIAVVTEGASDRDALWFRDRARKLYLEEARARANGEA